MPIIACVGHNTVDKYIHQGMMYPGGNEVNVAALTSRFGIESSYVGCIGNDIYGKLIIDALKTEDVNVSHCHVLDDVNTFTEIYLENGERSFGKIRRGASTRCEITNEDVDFILSHQVLHTGFYSRMEAFLSQYHDQIIISFDFSEYADEEYILNYIKYVDIAFISSQTPESEDNEYRERTMKKYYELGPDVVILTKGNHGSYLFDGTLHYQPAIELDKVIDTLGAGDSFISRFIVEYLKNTSNAKALLHATQSAAKTCQHFGAFNHGITIPD
jgi:fructoselysine 6-kinase